MNLRDAGRYLAGIVLLALGMALGAPRAVAQLYWDTNGKTPGSSSGTTAPGTWGVDNFWSTDSSGSRATTGWTQGQLAVFSAGANASGTYTVNVAGNQSASGITLQEGNLTLSGGTITLTGNATVTVAQNYQLTVASILAGSAGLIKSGYGTLLLKGTNTFTGLTDVQQGTLLLGNGSVLGGSILKLNGGSVGAGDADVIIPNVVDIANDSSIVGSHNLTFTGNVSQDPGKDFTLSIYNTALTTFSGTITIDASQNKNRNLTLNVLGGPVLISGVVQNGPGNGADGLIKQGSGTLILTGNNTFLGDFNVSGGSVFLGSDTAAGAGTLVLGNGVTLAATNGDRTIANPLSILGNVTFAGPDDFTFLSSFGLGGNRTFTVQNNTTFSGVISGSGYSLSKNGAGTLALTGNNTFSGGLKLQAGTLALGNNAAAGSGTLSLSDGVTLSAFNGDRAIGNALSFLGNVTFTGPDDFTFTSSFNLGGNRSFTVQNNTTFSGVISGAGYSLTKNGSGTLALTGNNTFSGGLNLQAGTLALGNNAAAGTGTLTLSDGVTLSAINGNRTIANALSFLGDVTFAGPNNFTFSSSFDLGGSRTFTVQNTTTFNGVISGANDSLTMDGNGTLVLNGANTFGGGLFSSLSVNSGTVAFGNNSAAGNASTFLALNGGAIQASGAPRTLSNPVLLLSDSTISGSQNLTLSGSLAMNLAGDDTLTVSNSGLTTFAGSTFTWAAFNSATQTFNVVGSSGGLVISNTLQDFLGSGTLVKDGAGSLTLSGSNPNTFAGGFIINNGQVTAAKLNALGSGSLTLNNGTLDIGSFNQSVTSVTMASGTINGTSGSLSASSFQMQSGTVNASLTGSGSLTKSSSGTLSLNKPNTYTGPTVINAGTVYVNNTSGSGTGTNSVTVNNTGTLAGTGSIAGQVTLNPGATLSPGITVGSLSTGAELWKGNSTFVVQMNNATSGEGSGWDILKIAGSLTISAASGPVQVDLQSLNLAGLPGLVSNFTNTLAYSWRIVSTTGGILFNPGLSVTNALSLDTTEFLNNTGSGKFSLTLANANKDLMLSFTPNQIPEPKAWCLIGLALVLIFLRRNLSLHQFTQRNHRHDS